MIPILKATIDAIQSEVIRSVQLWDETAMMNPDLEDGVRLPILVEEVGEVAKAMNEGSPREELISELDQVAAMAASWAQVERDRLNGTSRRIAELQSDSE